MRISHPIRGWRRGAAACISITVLSAMACSSHVRPGPSGLPSPPELIEPFDELRLEQSRIGEVLALLGPGLIGLASADGEGEVDAEGAVVLQYDSVIELDAEVPVRAHLYLAPPDFALQTVVLDLQAPVDLSRVHERFGTGYTRVFCRPEPFQGELEGGLVRGGEESDYLMLAYDREDLVVEVIEGRVEALRFTLESAEGVECP